MGKGVNGHTMNGLCETTETPSACPGYYGNRMYRKTKGWLHSSGRSRGPMSADSRNVDKGRGCAAAHVRTLSLRVFVICAVVFVAWGAWSCSSSAPEPTGTRDVNSSSYTTQ